MNKKIIVVFSLISIVSFLLLSKNESYSISNIKKMNSNIEELPAKYDLRNVGGKNYAPTVKNQGFYGICWDFGLVSAMESSIIKSGLVDSNEDISLSTRYFDFATSGNLLELQNPYGNRLLGEGTFSHGILDFLLISGMGPVEMKAIDDGIYGTWEGYAEGIDFTSDNKLPIKSVLNNTLSSYTVTDTMLEDTMSDSKTEKEKAINNMKHHLMTYGALSATLLGPGGTNKCLIFDDDNDFYINIGLGDCNYNHEMTLIGWDDNYEVSYCDSYHEDGDTIIGYGFDKDKCLNDGYEWITRKGAWIIQNSWGEYRTYGHASYESIFSVYGITGIVKKDWNNNYNTITSSFKKTVDNDKNEVYDFLKIDNLDESITRLSFIKGDCHNNVNVYLGKNCTSNCENYDYIGTIGDGIGIESLEINSELISNNYFSLKVSDSCIAGIGIYTNRDEIVNQSAKMIIDGVDGFDTKIELITNYLEPGTKIIYKLYDKDDYIAGKSEISSFDGYIINNVSKVDLEVSQKINEGQYILVAYHNNNEIASSSFYYDGKGFGNEANPYLISNREELEKICDTEKSRKSYYKLDSDLDLSNWKTICDTGSLSFQGVLDGDGHVISNFSVSDYGLFFQTEDATIKNLIFKNVNVESPLGTTGIISFATYYTNFEQIAIIGKVKKRSFDIVGLVHQDTESNFNNIFINLEYDSEQQFDLDVFISYPKDSNIENSYAIVHYVDEDDNENKSKSFIVDDNQVHYHTLDELKNKETYMNYGFDFDNIWQIQDGSLASLKIMTNKFDINENSDYEILDEKFITQISLNTKLSDYLNNFDYSNEYSVVVTKGNNILSNNDLISTGSVIKIYKNNKLVKSYVNIVLGDITGNGKSTISDVAKLYQFYKNKITMDECFIKAGDVVNNKKIGINDIAKLYQFVKGKINKL